MRHTPVLPVYAGVGFKRKLIGSVCRHCGMVYTENGNPNDLSYLVQSRYTGPRWRNSKRARQRHVLARRTLRRASE